VSAPHLLILAWNQREQTLRCLDSVRRLRGAAPRTVVIDNGSEDGTAAAVRAQFPAAELIELPHNLGYCGGFNHGLRLALRERAQAAVLLNNDTWLDPDCLVELAAASGAEPELLGPKIFSAADPERLQSAGAKVAAGSGRIVHLGYGQRDRGQFDSPAARDALSGCCLWINRAALERAGLLDEGYFAYFEDVEYCLRAQRLGARIELVPRARLWHRGGISLGGPDSARRLYYSVRNHLHVLDQHRPLPPSHRALRSAWVLSLSLAYLGLRTRIPRAEGLRALARAWHDHRHNVRGALVGPLS